MVIATGCETFFGRTAKLVAGAGAVSHAQKAMFAIGNFLIVLAWRWRRSWSRSRSTTTSSSATTGASSDALGILQFVLVLLVASIPVAMPAVFSITMALGALALSKEKAIVSKLSAIEEMAGVDILCSDKTGTLTKNQLTLADPILFAGANPQDCILAAALASKARGPRRDRYRGVRRAEGPERAAGFQAVEIRAVRSREQAHRSDGQRRRRQVRRW